MRGYVIQPGFAYLPTLSFKQISIRNSPFSFSLSFPHSFSAYTDYDSSPMVDALSVTGGAVGVISLGLSICQGLLAYYGPFKTFHEQISDIESRITALEGIFKVLERVLNEGITQFGPLTAQSTAVALGCIWSCQDRLNRLQIILQKCTQTNGSNVCTGFTRQVNRLLYPFRRETLMALIELLDWLQATLNTSLQMLTM